MRTRLVTIFVILLFGVQVYAQPPSFSASVDKSKIVIGEPFELLLKGTAGSSSKWLTVNSFPYFEILETGKVDTFKSGNVYTWQQSITMTSWDSGKQTIPSFLFAGKRSKPIPITVSFTPFDPKQEYHDIKEIIEVEKEPRTVWYWYVALGLFLLGLMALMFPAQKKGVAPAAASPDETIFKMSMQQLNALQHDGGRLDAKTFYTEMILVLRTYLHKRKGSSSYSKTTDDLVRQVPTLKLKKEQEAAFVAALQESDLMKFAQGQSTQEQREKDLQTIKAAIIAIEEN